MTPVQRASRWAVLVTATLVVVGVFLQAYLIAAYSFGGGEDALDAHTGVGDVVHGIEALVFLAAIVAYWRRWGEIGLGLALIVIGSVQLSLAESGEPWVAGLHGLFALLVLVLAAVITHRAVRALGLGRHGRMPGAP